MSTAGLHDLIRQRWSPTQFLDRAVEPGKLRLLFEAARWAASCFNEQPWRFILTTKTDPDAFAKALSMLAPRNQEWARTAWALAFSAGKRTFSHNGSPNRFGLHDTGASTANLALEAIALGLRTHFMGGFDTQRVRAEFHVPEDFEIGCAFAIGYIDEATAVEPSRTRKPIEEIVFEDTWGSTARL